MPRPSTANRVDVSRRGLANVLRALRRHLEWSQADLSRFSGVSAAMVAKLEQESRNPSRNVLAQVAAAFGLHGEELEDAANRVADVVPDSPQFADVLVRLIQQLAVTRDSGGRPSPVLPAETAGDYRADPDLITESIRDSDASLKLSNLVTALVLELRGETAERVREVHDQVCRLLELPAGDRELAGAALAFVESPAARTLAPAARQRLLATLAQEADEGRERQQVTTVPAGTVWHVLAEAVARDGDVWWIDPKAPVLPIGDAHEHPRVERLDDGRVLLDVSRIADQVWWVSRDPARHRLRAMLVRDTPPDVDALAEVYASTIIEIDWEGTTLALSRRAPGTTEGDYPADATVVHVLTAQNPRSRLLLGPENEERNRLLQRQLELRGWRFHPATGRSPDGSWTEQGFAIIDGDRDDVLALAREHEQNAIFEWTPESRSVVWCDHDRRDAHGWSASRRAV